MSSEDDTGEAAAIALDAAAHNNAAAANSAEAAALLARLSIGGGAAIPIDTVMPDLPLNSHVPSTYLLKQELDKKMTTITFDDEPTEGSGNAITSGAIYEFLYPIDWGYSKRMGNFTILPGKYIWCIAQDSNGRGEARGGLRIGMSSQEGTEPWSKADFTDVEAFGVSVYRAGERTEFFQFVPYEGQADDGNLVMRKKDLTGALGTVVTTIDSSNTDAQIPTAKAVYTALQSLSPDQMALDLSEIKALIGAIQTRLTAFAFGEP